MNIEDYQKKQTHVFDILRMLLYWIFALTILIILTPQRNSLGGNGGSAKVGVHGDGAGIGENAEGDGNGDDGELTTRGTDDGSAQAEETNGDAAQNTTQNNDTSGTTADDADEIPQNNAREFAKKTTSGTVVRKGGSNKGFFGVEIGETEGNVIFLLDVSGSMGASTSENITRLELLKKELTRVLKDTHKKYSENNNNQRGFRNLNGNTFQLIEFSDAPISIPPSGRLFRFDSAQDINKAVSLVNNLQISGGTNFLAAWKAIEDKHKKIKINTVYFLSDGEDSTLTTDWLKKNLPYIKIHTFSMGQDSPLLKSIANQHNGIYTIIK